MSYRWTAYYVNSENDVKTVEETVKSSAGTRFQICELKFKSPELREAFDEKVKEKFVKTCGTTLNKEAVEQLFNIKSDVWITPYGNIKLSFQDSEF